MHLAEKTKCLRELSGRGFIALVRNDSEKRCLLQHDSVFGNKPAFFIYILPYTYL